MEELNKIKSPGDKVESGGLSLKDMFYKYIRFLPFFLLSVTMALLAAFGYLRYSTRIYSASGNMLIKNTQNRNQGGDRVEDILSGSDRSQNIQNEIEVLKSRPLMARVVNKLGLQLSYTAKGRIKDQNAYGQAPFALNVYKLTDSSESFAMNIRFTGSNKFRVNNDPKEFTFGQVFANNNGVFQLQQLSNAGLDAEYTLQWRPTENVARALASKVKVQPKVTGTGILILSIEATNPRMAADIVNTLMVQYDSLTIEQNNYSTDQKLAFIDARLNDLRNELDSIQLILLEYRQKHNLIDVTTQSTSSFARINEVDKAVLQEEMNISLVNFVTGYLEDKSNQFAQVVVPSSLGLQDMVLNDLINQYNAAQIERKSLLEANIPPANPAVRQAEALIEEQRQRVLENLKNIKLTYLQNIGTLKGSSRSEEKGLSELPFKMKEVVDLERQVNTKLGLLTLMEGKKEEAAIARASTISNSSIIDRASVNMAPVKPNKQLIRIIAVLIGLGLPAVIIFFIELLNDKITTRHDIERITDVPIIGEVGHSYSTGTLVVNKNSRSMVAEQFRTIRTNLDYILTKKDKPVILVTSSFSGEGKSFVSTNMGAVLALTGKKTVVLEFDIRKPRILSGLNIKRGKGVSNFLAGKAELEELILPVTEQENLFVLPCGPIPPNPSELLLDSRVEEVFTWLRTRFDMIIIDTAPVGMVSDAMTLSKFADCTLYLVRQGHTFKKQITLIDEMYKDNKLPKISIVINDVKARTGYGYYGYGRYGYGYGYGSDKGTYYQEEEPTPGKFEKFLASLSPGKWFKKTKS